MLLRIIRELQQCFLFTFFESFDILLLTVLDVVDVLDRIWIFVPVDLRNVSQKGILQMSSNKIIHRLSYLLIVTKKDFQLSNQVRY